MICYKEALESLHRGDENSNRGAHAAPLYNSYREQCVEINSLHTHKFISQKKQTDRSIDPTRLSINKDQCS